MIELHRKTIFSSSDYFLVKDANSLFKMMKCEFYGKSGVVGQTLVKQILTIVFNCYMFNV